MTTGGFQRPGRRTGTGTDVFYVEGRGGQVTWAPSSNFHGGQSATIFGFNPGVSIRPFTAGERAKGYQGLTVHPESGEAGTGINPSMTFASVDQATVNAHVTTTSGTTNAGTASATGYLLIQYNH